MIVSTWRSLTASNGRLPSRRMAWTIGSSGQGVPASTIVRSTAQRSSSHRQPSAVASRRSRRRGGSSGSSGPRWARRSRSAQTPKRRTKFGTRGGGRRRRPRSATSARRCSAVSVPSESAIKASWTRSARSSRQDRVATWRTRSCSKGLAGSSWAVQSSRRRWNSRGSSPGRMRVSAVRPWVTAFSRARALPLRVRGPVERAALRRLASACLVEVIALVPSQESLGLLRCIRETRANRSRHASGCPDGYPPSLTILPNLSDCNGTLEKIVPIDGDHRSRPV